MFIVEKWNENNVFWCIDYNLYALYLIRTSDTMIFWKWPPIETQGHFIDKFERALPLILVLPE